MEARDEDPVPHRSDQLLASRGAARHREMPGVPARGVARRVRRVTGRPRPHRLRRGAVVDRAARDATLDEHDLLLRRAFDVERGGDGSRIHRVIEEREILAGDALADAAGHERAALSHGLPTETGERADAKYFGDRE